MYRFTQISDHPSFEVYKTVGKKLINGELWTMAREWANHNPAEKKEPSHQPIHVLAVMQTRIRGDAHNPLITTGIRDDCISKFMAAQNAMTKGVLRVKIQEDNCVQCFSKKEVVSC